MALLVFPTAEANLIRVRENVSFNGSVEERELKKKLKGPKATKDKKCKGTGKGTSYAENCFDLKKQLLAIESQMVEAIDKSKPKVDDSLFFSVTNNPFFSSTFGVGIRCAKDFISPCLDIEKQLHDLEDEMVCFAGNYAKKNDLNSEFGERLSENENVKFSKEGATILTFGVLQVYCLAEEQN